MEPIGENELLDALRQHGTAMPRKPAGEGWYTLAELARAENATMPAIKYRMECAKKRGVQIDTQPGTALDDEGKPRRTTYYRLRNGKP